MDVASSNLPFPLHMGWAKNLLINIYIVGLFLLPFSFRGVFFFRGVGGWGERRVAFCHLLFSTSLFVYTTTHLAPVVDFRLLSYC